MNSNTSRENNPRRLAWQCLQRWGQGGVFAETLIERECGALTPRNRALVQAAVLGTLPGWYIALAKKEGML